VGLKPEFLNTTFAPFVKESKVKFAFTLEEIIPIKLNNTFLVIGKIQQVKLDDSLPDGFLEIDKVSCICSNGIDGSYFYPTN
jgi:flavin reductase (DIM6/NTAB) family NADH-FMN oxidoreductase RutF